MGTEARLESGEVGQFDILADGELIGSREKGFWARLLSGGWPDERVIVDRLRQRLQSAG